MAEKKFDAQVNYGWGLSLNMTGKAPAIAKTIWDTYADMIAYVNDYNDSAIEGLQLSVVADPNEKLNGIYFVNKVGTAEEDGIVTLVGSGSGSMSIANFTITDDKIEEATVDNISQVIYVTGGTETYPAGPYIVTGDGTVAKLGTTTATGDIAGDVNTLKGEVATLENVVGDSESGLVKDVADLQTAVNNLPETFVTDVKVGETSLVADGVADLSNFVQKDGDKVLSTNDYTTAEKEKLAGIAEGAEVNYIKSVGENLSVNDGQLDVNIPEAKVQGISEDDPLLILGSDGVLSTSISFERGFDEAGNDSLLLKGNVDQILGSVSVSDFIADGMLKSVEPIEGTNKFKFTFNTDENADGSSDSFEVDFSKYVDTYHADGTTIELVVVDGEKTFKVKDNVFEAAGEAAKVQNALNEYIGTNDAAVSALSVKLGDYYTKTEAEGKFADVAHAITDDERAKLANIAENAQVNVIETVTVDGVELTPENKTVNIDLSAKVDKVENHSLVSNDLITKLEELATINSVGKNLSIVENELQVDFSNLVVKVEGKGLSANDFTNELKTKLEGIATGAEVNYVKSVGANLSVSDAGELTVDLSALATSDSLTNGLATKLDASAKVNGVSFADGEATLDAGDIALEAAITRTENGEQKNVYEATSSIQSVLAGLSARIDTLDPNISGEFGVSAITAGNGIEVSGASSTPTISVKASTVEGNMAEVKTDGVYVQDMRSYWEAI